MNGHSTLQFLGGVETVTGSKYLISTGRQRLLLDCGLFQGLKELRLRNWEIPPFDPRAIDAVILSHAHIDHCGYLPLLVRQGFQGPVYCTGGTQSLLQIVLPDAAHLQEEDAAYANRHGFSKHHPAQPLFAAPDAERALRLVQPQAYHEPFQVAGGVSVVFRRTGHILGSASMELQIPAPSPVRLIFSGDLGRWNRPMLRDPEFVAEADILLVESTYGDRNHPGEDPSEQLAKVVVEAAARGGALLIPAFAIGRTQELMWRIRELEEAARIPRLPTFVDSPMATDATAIFCRHPEDHSIDMKLLMDEHRCPLCCKPCTFTRTPEESKALNDHKEPIIIIAASGMATGGRIIHHLKQRLPDPRTTVLLVGYQAAGTRGRLLQNGAKSLRMHGRDIPVHAQIAQIHGLSAHADRTELLKWLGGFRKPPRETFIVHGEQPASLALSKTLQEWGWTVTVPSHQAVISLEAK